jgi:hypothetical protein
MVQGSDFSGLPLGDCDEIYRDPYPGIIVGSYGEDLAYNL